MRNNVNSAELKQAEIPSIGTRPQDVPFICQSNRMYKRPSSSFSSLHTNGKVIEEKTLQEQNIPWPPLLDHCSQNNLSTEYQTAQPVSDLNIPLKPQATQSEAELSLAMQPLTLQQHPTDFVPAFDSQGPAAHWIASRREEVVRQMTEACLNQSLDALLSLRKLLDTCERHSEEFCRVVVRKLQENKQLGLQPYPDLSTTTSQPPPYTPSNVPFHSNSCNNSRNI
ncbi:hypothetical protein DNTS_027933 [Danionella cerebrum]|uniref:CARD domain-containing protein n=1 Tax=Danionella cerebrum TaxID=2873325 RepID=A0A553REZ7_9TELE|nr:hypothetical protein DNTS_027933 [Danionella translucida]